jgi:DNA-binding SARP family transcriptional activator
MPSQRRGASPRKRPIDEAELAAIAPTLFTRASLWPGLALADDAADHAERSPWSAYWALRLGSLSDPAADRARLETAYATFSARGECLGALLAVAAAIETYYFDETPLEPLDSWIERLERALAAAQPPWPNAECGAEIMACGSGVLLRQPAHALLAQWAAQAPRALARTAPGPSRIKYAAFVVQHHLWRGEFGTCASVIDALPGVDLSLLRPPEALLWLHGVAAYSRFTAEFARGQAAVQEAMALIERHGLASHAYHAHAHGAALALAAQQPPAAAAHLDAMRSMLGARSQADQTLYWHLRTGQALQRRRAQDAVALARSTIEHSNALGGAYHGVIHRLSLASTLLVAGDASAAAAEALAALEAARSVGATLNIFSAGLVLSQALARAGRHAEADAALSDALRVAAVHDFPTSAGWWLPEVVADRLARAFELGIEPAYSRRLAQRNHLRCPRPTLESWPWPLMLRGFGEIEVRVDGQALTARGSRVAQRPLDLLRALLAHGGMALPVATALEWLWPEADHDQQRKAFDAALLRLRRLLGDDSLLLLDSGQLLLDRERCWSDVAALSQGDWSPAAHGDDREALLGLAERLLSLVRAPLLDGQDAPWVLGARERARRRFVLALVPMAEQLSLVAPADACRLYERALQVDPLAESLSRRLMAAQLARGERSEALRAWHHCKTMLGLHGAWPSAATLALARQASFPV